MEELLNVKDLTKIFYVKSNKLFHPKKKIYAVNNVNFTINKKETVGLVGESGCGKSTIARLILRLIKPTSGKIYFEGKDISTLKHKELTKLREKFQIIFQDPYSSLNPRKTILDIVSEPLIIHKKFKTKKEIEEKVKFLLNLVGISTDYLHHYPHEFSGGQRQRIGIARAIALEPKLIICDEPVSALDVSIQAQVINLLIELKEKLGLSYLFIAHDLSVVKHISDRIIVMYLGKIVEEGHKKEIFSNPLHPYTKSLISAIPEPDINVKKERIILKGDVDSPTNFVKGCPFCKRCYMSKSICFEKEPPLLFYGDNHKVLCHFVNLY
ncbi:MAG TPA: ATP-binding cassette domain-containing protein [Spirochaetota bacterium]|nr:ATP-binding cassette domain-containing protein [Spirochaetota bacterium]HOL57807.1 ATP-binding cassette domain-containing protein [Spirochaetota bacterium]HPP05420.1 ATP-binding cassette domain-containing protein [Spirochaetota bacterium]